MKQLWTLLLLSFVCVTSQSPTQKCLFFSSQEDTIKAAYNGFVKDFLAALQKVTGLTKNQVQQLETRFRQVLYTIPTPSSGEPDFLHLAWVLYATRITTQAIYATQQLLDEALKMAANNSLDKGQLFGNVATNFEKRIKDMFGDLTTSFLRTSRRIRGLNEKQISKLEDDFKKRMNSMATPPPSSGYFFNPSAWAKFCADAGKRALQLTAVLLNEAKGMVANLAGQGNGQGNDELGNIVDPMVWSIIEKEIEKILDEAVGNIEKGINKKWF